MGAVDETFSKVIDALSSAAKANKVNYINGQPKWVKLKDAGAELLNGLDSEEIEETFSRDGTAKAYAEALTVDNSYREPQASKVQGDILSALERDVRMRYRSGVAMVHHAAARQATHSLEVGPIQGALKFVSHLLDSGSEDPPADSGSGDQDTPEAQAPAEETTNGNGGDDSGNGDGGGSGTPTGSNQSPNAAPYDPNLWQEAVVDSLDPVDKELYDLYNGTATEPPKSVLEISDQTGIPPSGVNDRLNAINATIDAGPGTTFDCSLGAV